MDNECDVALLRDCVAWFLDTQDPELDDAVYDRSDRIILRDILLPRIACPFDVNDGTCKDLGLATQCLETALAEGAVQGSGAPTLLKQVKDYAAREKHRLSHT